MSIERVGVLGAGTMGCGIAEVAAVAGLRVILWETDAGQRERAPSRITASLEKGIAGGKVHSSCVELVLPHIEMAADLAAMGNVDFCIETVTEDETIKRQVFEQLGRICKPETVLASNTSSISITRLAAASGRPEQVIGMHFFNPVPIILPIEIVVGLQTSQATIDTTTALARRFGKLPLRVNDSPGFVVNRILMPLINEAAFVLMEGVADAITIDELMVHGCRYPMGPLRLADLIGIDVCLAILDVLQRELGDPKFRPCPLLRRMVDTGRLGRKTGQGFYSYPK